MSVPANAYAEAFGRFANRLPEFERFQREAQFDAFLATGFPGPSAEDWHYTDLAPLAERRYTLAADDELPLLVEPLPDTERLVYLNGQCNTVYSTGKHLHSTVTAKVIGEEGVDALNAAFATGGLSLKLAKNARLERPLHVLLQGQSDSAGTMTHQRHRIELGANADATVLLHFAGHGAARFETHVVEVVLAPGARLRLHRLADEAEGATLVTRIDVRALRDARLEMSAVDVGSGLTRHDCTVTLAEAGAEVELAGLYVPRRGAHVDNYAKIVHAAPHCRSRLHWRGIVDERARAVFRGKVVVQTGAQKTDSEQHIANLLLSRKAEINAKPELEIYADDVKCAHGATVGRLDESALAYLRSRGIPRDAARALLLRAFATGILEKIDWPDLRARIESSLKLPTELPEQVEA